MEFGLPQNRDRVFTISVLNGEPFDFETLPRTQMKNVWDFIQPDGEVDERYTIRSPSMVSRIDPENIDSNPIDKLSVIGKYAMTITGKQEPVPE